MPIPIVDLPGEVWKPVVGWEGAYDVSNMGRVRSVPRRCNRGVCGRLETKPHLMSPVATIGGYLKIDMKRDGARLTKTIHLLVLEAFCGLRPEGMEACHNNGDPTDNRLANLRWDTRKANQRDRIRHGTALVGERHPRAKLTEREVLEMRRAAGDGVPVRELAERFNIHVVHAYAVIKGKAWSHVKI